MFEGKTGNQERQEDREEVREEEAKPEGLIKCEFCRGREFSKEEDYLFHLSLFHFRRELLEKFPFKVCVLHPHQPSHLTVTIQEGEQCSQCELVCQPPLSSYLQHVGVFHQQILTCLPQHQDTAPPSEEIQVPPLVQTETAQPPSVECLECKQSNKVKIFEKRSEFLKHLSLGHYGKQLLQKYPFKEGENCSFCQEAGKKGFTAGKRELHVCHTGVLHGKLFDFLTDETKAQIAQLPHIRRHSLPVAQEQGRREEHAQPDHKMVNLRMKY